MTQIKQIYTDLGYRNFLTDEKKSVKILSNLCYLCAKTNKNDGKIFS